MNTTTKPKRQNGEQSIYSPIDETKITHIRKNSDGTFSASIDNGQNWSSIAPQTFAALAVTYDNSTSGLISDNVQFAIDEVAGLVKSGTPNKNVVRDDNGNMYDEERFSKIGTAGGIIPKGSIVESKHFTYDPYTQFSSAIDSDRDRSQIIKTSNDRIYVGQRGTSTQYIGYANRETKAYNSINMTSSGYYLSPFQNSDYVYWLSSSGTNSIPYINVNTNAVARITIPTNSRTENYIITPNNNMYILTDPSGSSNTRLIGVNLNTRTRINFSGTAQPTTGGSNYGIAYSSHSNKVYVYLMNYGTTGSATSVIYAVNDSTGVGETIEVRHPDETTSSRWWVYPTAINDKVVFSDEGGRQFLVLDTNDNTVTYLASTIGSGFLNYGLPMNNKIYYLNNTSRYISVLDMTTNEHSLLPDQNGVATVLGGGITKVKDNYIYNIRSGSISVIDTLSEIPNSSTSFAIPSLAYVGYIEIDNKLYMKADTSTTTIVVIDISNASIPTYSTIEIPQSVFGTSAVSIENRWFCWAVVVAANIVAAYVLDIKTGDTRMVTFPAINTITSISAGVNIGRQAFWSVYGTSNNSFGYIISIEAILAETKFFLSPSNMDDTSLTYYGTSSKDTSEGEDISVNVAFVRKEISSVEIVVGFDNNCDIQLDPDALSHTKDIATAINSLPNSGGKIVFKAGTYKASLAITKDNVTVNGMGASTIFSGASVTNSYCKINGITVTGTTNIATTASFCEVYNCITNNFGIAGSNNIFSNNIIKYTGSGVSGSNNIVSNNIFSTTNSGILLDIQGIYNQFIGNSQTGVTTSTLRITGAGTDGYNTISNNSLVSPIIVFYSNENIITSNSWKLSTANKLITLNAAKRNIIDSNFMKTSYLTGTTYNAVINLDWDTSYGNADYNKISNNIIVTDVTATTPSVGILRGSYNVISNNLFIGSTTKTDIYINSISSATGNFITGNSCSGLITVGTYPTIQTNNVIANVLVP